jgi:hypothetical protein
MKVFNFLTYDGDGQIQKFMYQSKEPKENYLVKASVLGYWVL